MTFWTDGHEMTLRPLGETEPVELVKCAWCQVKHDQAKYLYNYLGELVCRDCAASDDGHEYAAKVNHHVYFFENYLSAHDFALFWRGLVIDEEGKVINDFEKLPF